MRNMGGMSGDPTRDGVPERVVQATIRLLAEQGPSAIKARTVASASGLSTMAVYHHFGGIARENPHLYDLMFGLSTRRATYRPLPESDARLSGRSPAFHGAYVHLAG